MPQSERTSPFGTARADDYVTARDLADAAYCARVPLLRRWVRRPPQRTPSMWHGLARHAEARMEDRRVPERYGFRPSATVRREVRLRSPDLGLSGQIDLLLDDGRRIVPVDLKFGEGAADPADIAQVLGYCALVEATTGRTPTEGIVDRRETGQVLRVPYDDAARALVRDLLALVRGSLAEDRLPTTAPQGNRCAACDVRRLCQAT